MDMGPEEEWTAKQAFRAGLQHARNERKEAAAAQWKADRDMFLQGRAF